MPRVSSYLSLLGESCILSCMFTLHWRRKLKIFQFTFLQLRQNTVLNRHSLCFCTSTLSLPEAVRCFARWLGPVNFLDGGLWQLAVKIRKLMLIECHHGLILLKFVNRDIIFALCLGESFAHERVEFFDLPIETYFILLSLQGFHLLIL